MLCGIEYSRLWLAAAAAGLLLCLLSGPSTLSGRDEATLEELKGRVANASVADRPPLCLHIAELQLGAADRLYVIGDSEKAQAALADLVAYSELARDYAIQSRKHEKQSEIAIRKMVRKLSDMEHASPHQDQAAIQSAIDRLQRIRDDLQAAIFSKDGKQ
jgi:hypothetical protein